MGNTVLVAGCAANALRDIVSMRMRIHGYGIDFELHYFCQKHQKYCHVKENSVATTVATIAL